jgi:N-acetylmuramoyl-L-alanine amidase
MKNNFYYKLIAVFCVMCILLSNVFAAGIYEPGITGEETPKKGEFNYKEVVFLTGEPILLSGTAKITESKTTTGSKTTVEYKLENTAKNAKLDRKITYINTNTSSKYDNQIARSTVIDPKFKETVQIGSDTFNLTAYQYSKSGLTDDKAIIKYNVYNWNGKKTYAKNSGDEVVIDIKADTYSYDNYWSTTETSLIYNTLTYKYKDTGSSSAYKEAVGTVEYAVSNSKVKNMEYMINEPGAISFKGGYILKENEENVVTYSYDVPLMTGGTTTEKRSKGRSSYKLATVPTQTRLFAPPLKDVVSSYWAAADIKAIAALDIISAVDTNYFRPLSYVSRAEFTRAIVKSANIPEKPMNRTQELLFDDVEKNHPYFSFINTAVSTGIISGTGSKKFSPDDYLTKAQAATIIVRAMGLEESSTASAVKTNFADDYKIPSWSKKSVNIARSMGIIKSDEDNMLQPDKLMTRAEVSEMINKFIKYLQYDIRKEYREKLINYGR